MRLLRSMLAIAIAVFVLGSLSVPAFAKSPVKASATLIDVNSASRDALAKLPGIGEVYAAKIVKGRPYRVKTELKSRGILPAATYAKVENRIIARQK